MQLYFLLLTAQAEEQLILSAEDLALADEEELRPLVELPMIYTGSRKGVAGELNPFAAYRRVSSLYSSEVEIEHRYDLLVQGNWNILPSAPTADGMRELQMFLKRAETEVSCSKVSELNVWRTNTDHLYSSLETQHLLELTQALGTPDVAEHHLCTSGELSALLYGPQQEPLPNWSGFFEPRRALEILWEKEQHLFFSQPQQDLSRTVAEIERYRNEVPNALYVDAGNFLDGANTLGVGLSTYRPVVLSALAHLQPDALLPGYTELLVGASSFLEEVNHIEAERGFEFPYLATNWESSDPALDFPDYRLVDLQTEQGVQWVAFVGIVDPALHQQIPQLAEEGISITDPVEAVQAVVDQIFSDGHEPDLVVALTTANAKVLEEVRKNMRGVDLLIGDPTLATFRIEERSVHFRNLGFQTKGAPLTLPSDGLSTVDLLIDTGSKHLDHLTNQPIMIRADKPLNEELSQKVAELQMQAYPELSSSVLYTDQSGAEPLFSDEEWEQMLCEALRRRSSADVVLLREFSKAPPLPGSISGIELSARLALVDELEVHYIPGTQFQRFLDQSYGVLPVSCGALPGSRSPKARGRSLESDRIYRVVTTDRSRSSSNLDVILNSMKGSKIFDATSTEHLLTEDAEVLGVRQAILEEVTSLSQEHAPEVLSTYLLEESPKEIPPLLLLRVRKLSLAANRFEGMESDLYSAVPETLANTASNINVAVTGDIAFDYSSSLLQSDLRWTSAFSELRTDEQKQELGDDWQLSSALSAPGLSVSMGESVRWMPYEEIRFDSEYTPIELEDGSINPLQSDLSLTLGVRMSPWRTFRSVRVGLLANRDMRQLEEKPTELGAKLQWESKKSINSSLIWTSSGDLQWYGTTPDDDISDLSYRFYGESKLSVPLSRSLAISIFTQGLGIKGRVPETDELGFAWNVGGSLDLFGAFELD